MNRVVLMGRLTADPTLSQTPSGTAVCRFTIAVNRKFADKETGERQADFINCRAWKTNAEFISRYFTKGQMLHINSDFRVMLNVYAAFGDPELTDEEKCLVCMINLYGDIRKIPPKDMQDAINKAYWFASGGDSVSTDNVHRAKILDWEQDERIIFPAINKVAGCETRALPYLHWWSFLGLFGEIGEGLLSQVLHIRSKKSKGKKLEKWEEEFVRENKGLVEIREKYTKEEQAKIDRLNALLG